MNAQKDSGAQALNEQENFYSKMTKSFSNGMVPVFENENGDLCCDARKLHRTLKSGTQFNKWIERKLLTDDFQEDEDFWSKLTKSSGGRKPVDYILTLDTAKELAMMERNAEGKKVRRYFIKIEKAFKAMLKALYTPINGITPLHNEGKIGYPRKEFLMSIGLNPKNGHKQRKRWGAKNCFNIFRTACLSAEVCELLLSEKQNRDRAKQIKANQLNLSL